MIFNAEAPGSQCSGEPLDPVTFEVLKNAFINLVDQMGEQLLRTCHSFVIYNRDFSGSLCDAAGNTVMQGTEDIAVHVGTGHLAAYELFRVFGDDINPGDVFIMNDPYVGGTHISDVRLMRPVFVDDELIAFTQSCGHWADVGGPIPGSFNLQAREYFAEGLRIPAVKIWDRGVFRQDIAQLITLNMRLSEDRMGDLLAQAQATKVGEDRLLELVAHYGKDVIVRAFAQSQEYVESMARAKIAALPDGTWTTEDYIDADPAGEEGLIPIRLTMTIEGDNLHYDLTGSHGYIGCFLNSAAGTTFSSLIAGTKAFMPDLPLNSGLFRAVTATIPEDTVVNAPSPVAVTGFCTGVHEKLANSIYELWSAIVPERAIACSFNIEYLLIGGWDRRPGYDNYFMWYDWEAGGWGGRRDRDGCNATASVFGVGLSIQSVEAQERLSPIVMTEHSLITDSGGPGRFRGGCGVQRGCEITEADGTVVSYAVDRARSLPWGIEGGQPSTTVGVWRNPGREDERYMGAVFSGVPVGKGDVLTRPSGGGGGLGDPLERTLEEVLEDVKDEYVSVERAALDYGVVIEAVDPEICDYRVDHEASALCRQQLRVERLGWIEKDPAEVREAYLHGEITVHDVFRRYGVILDMSDHTVLTRSTTQFRAMLRRRMTPFWALEAA